MSIFTLHNTTRYNTDDILSLLNDVERVVSGTHPPAPGYVSAYGTCLSYSTEIHVVYFGGKDTSKKVSCGIRSNNPVLKIVRPENLYDNPLEALSQMVGVVTLPKEVYTNIAELLVSFYDMGASHTPWRDRGNIYQKWLKGWDHRQRKSPATGHIRIEDTPAAPEGKKAKQFWAKENKAHRATRRAAWAMTSVRRAMKTIYAAAAVFDALGEIAPEREAARDAIKQFIDSYEKAEKAINPTGEQ